MEKLIRALRCVATTEKDFTCPKDCPYILLKEVPQDISVPAHVTIDGIGYWQSCDITRMVLEAADALEKQIPKKPVLDLSKSLRDRCPSCGSVIFTLYEDETKFPHCQWCGQKLDWEEK